MSDNMRGYKDFLSRGDFVGLVREMQRKGDLPVDPLCDFKVGDQVYIESIKYWIGKIYLIDDNYVALQEALWVANTGRFHEAFDEGMSLSAVGSAEWEQAGPPSKIWWIRRETIVCATTWDKELPRGTR